MGVAVVPFSTSLGAEGAEDSLHQVIVVVCLPLINHVLALSLDPRMLPHRKDGFLRQDVPLSHDQVLNHALFLHLLQPEVQERLLGRPIAIQNH